MLLMTQLTLISDSVRVICGRNLFCESYLYCDTSAPCGIVCQLFKSSAGRIFSQCEDDKNLWKFLHVCLLDCRIPVWCACARLAGTDPWLLLTAPR